MIRQILQQRNIDEQMRPGSKKKQKRGEQEDQSTIGKPSEPRRRSTEALGHRKGVLRVGECRVGRSLVHGLYFGSAASRPLRPKG
jgi:hypothetical protein